MSDKQGPKGQGPSKPAVQGSPESDPIKRVQQQIEEAKRSATKAEEEFRRIGEQTRRELEEREKKKPG
jgi:hypothetical protein